MKVSFITTVLNEEKTISSLLNSLSRQTRKPDEIVIVDGGSDDGTVKEIETFKESHSTTMIYIIVVKGANRAKGRNEAIKQATGDIIAVSDAGCILDKKWLEEITKLFTAEFTAEPSRSPRRSHGFTSVQPATVRGGSVSVVAGYYQPEAKNIFQKCLACYTSVMPDKIDPNNFLPSSRSVAFKKSAWEKVGGYPENLDYCEDLVFCQKLKKAGLKFIFSPNALVYWPQKESLIQAFIQLFHYASGDVQARYWPHLRKIGLVFGRYILGAGIVWRVGVIWGIGAIGVYLLWAVGKNYRYVHKPSALFYLPVLQITSDLAVISGAILCLVPLF